MQVDAPLYECQSEVLAHLKNGKHVFAMLPTGSGKSRCYEVPAMAWDWRVLVVSPLVALMEDQYHSLSNRGVRVARLHSALLPTEKREEMQKIRSCEARLILISPERFLQWWESGLLTEMHSQEPFRLLALDELHCAADWAEFRESYQQIGEPIRFLCSGQTLFLGLSASLAPAGARDLLLKWNIAGELVIRPLGRENIQQFIIPCSTEGERHFLLSAFLRDLRAPSTAIIYCTTRRSAEALCDFLNAMGFDAIFFHAGLPAQIRLRRVLDFREGRLRIVCASSAFGMGIDYPHVERVIHFGLPYDSSAYWQATGRAGRNGKPAQSYVLWLRSDVLRLREMPLRQRLRARALWSIFLQEECRKVLLAKDLGLVEGACNACDVCWRKNPFSVMSYLPDPQHWLRRQCWWLENRADTLAWIDENFFLV